MLRNDKDAVIAEVQQLLTDTENLFVSDYRGLTVEELAELRGKLRQSGASLKIVKNTLGGIAADWAADPPTAAVRPAVGNLKSAEADVEHARPSLPSRAHAPNPARGGVLPPQGTTRPWPW